MTPERFNELLNGPLHHPLMPFRVTRLAMVLLHVLTVCGEKADQALEDWCKHRDEQDNAE